MTRITQRKELEQFELHKFDYKKTPEDKAYQTFLNSIFDEDGNLHKTGGTDIPEVVVEICRVFDGLDTKKEYLVYDVNQWGHFEDGTRTPYVHLQDIGVWYDYEWVRRQLPMPVYTGTPQRRQYKDYPESSKNKYDIPFTKENLDKIRKKSQPSTRLYVYDTAKSGRGGKDGKIGVAEWKDFEERSFQELIEGTYLLKTKLEQQIKAMQQKEEFLNLREKVLENQEIEKAQQSSKK